MINIDPVLAFKQFGFKEGSSISGSQIKGICPFCHKEDHFFINVQSENKTWDCKKCGRAGGFQKFLCEVIEFAKGKNLQALSLDRGIDTQTLRSMDIGFINGVWVLPVYDNTKTKILNIKIYDGSSFRNTASCSVTMYGLWCLPTSYDKIYLTEGEWDYLSLKDATNSSVAIVGAPGAGTFKTDSIPLFLSKQSYILYDNDEAGKRGAEKVSSLLISVASEVRVIRWPKGFPDGFDIRDAYKRRRSGLLQYVESLCEKYTTQSSTPVIQIDIKPIDSIQDAYAVFNKWILLKNNELLDVIFGTILANRMKSIPVWMFIVAPPGGTKTLPLMTLTNCAGIETLSSLTPATLISGYSLGGNDPSLIPHLDQKTLVIKDFTVIMGLPMTERQEIMSILRDAFDGECKKSFANGVTRRYKSKFGMLAGVTPAIEIFADENTELGERFLRWRNDSFISDLHRRKTIERAMMNVAHEEEMRLELSSVAKRILLADYTGRIPLIDKNISRQFIYLADWITYLRGVVRRDKFSKCALYKPSQEVGTRICQELTNLFCGISMLYGKINNSVFSTIRNVAKSTINVRFYDVIKYIYGHGNDRMYTIVELQQATGLPMNTTTVIIDDLLLLKVLTKSSDGFWQLTRNFKQLTIESKVFE